MNERISVIMSVYNEPIEYLRLSVNSILSQTYRNIQFIIVLDNPENNQLLNYLLNYEKKDNRVLLLRNPINIGLTASLNRALEVADGKYIARMDADDISEPNRIEKQIAYIKLFELDLVGCETRWISSTNEVIKKRHNKSYPPQCIDAWLMYEDCIAHPSWLVKHTVYRSLKGYRDIKACEDYDFLLRARRKGYKLGICDEVLLSYRINDKGISQNNLLRQVLSSYYLQKNYRKIDKITQDDIDKYLAKRNTLENNKNYVQGIQYLYVASNNAKRKSIGLLWNLLLSVRTSRFVWINLRMIVNLIFIRKKYR